MLPLSKAVIAVVGLFYAVGYWNVFFNALLYIDDNDKWPLQRVLQSYILAGQAPHGRPAVSVPGSTACRRPWRSRWPWSWSPSSRSSLVYPFVQRHFTKGVLIGAVKG